jgi:uncharacterized RDD family membrane protein YckC
VNKAGSMQIYVTREGQRTGPYSLEEVNRHLATGTLRPIDQAWSEGFPGWKPVLSFPGVIMPGGASSTAIPIGTATVRRAGAVRYAGFWIRTAAFAIDAVILAIPAGVIQIALGPPPADPASGHALLAVVMALFLALIYFASLWSSGMEATIGQRVCRLRVIDLFTHGKISFTRAVGRCLGLFLSLTILLVGVVMIAWNQRKLGLHDIICGTCVVGDQAGEEAALGL